MHRMRKTSPRPRCEYAEDSRRNRNGSSISGSWDVRPRPRDSLSRCSHWLLDPRTLPSNPWSGSRAHHPRIDTRRHCACPRVCGNEEAGPRDCGTRNRTIWNNVPHDARELRSLRKKVVAAAASCLSDEWLNRSGFRGPRLGDSHVARAQAGALRLAIRRIRPFAVPRHAVRVTKQAVDLPHLVGDEPASA